MKKIVRLKGYDDLETGRKLAQSDLTQITNLGLAVQEDLANEKGRKGRLRSRSNRLRWVDDHILCFVAKFDLDDTTYVIDMLWKGEDSYADFKYAGDSKEARKKAIFDIENWIECTTDTGGFYDPNTGVIHDGRGNIQLDENGEPNKISGFEE